MRRFFKSSLRGRGFTIVEILIAMSVLTVFMMSSTGLMRWVVRSADYSGRLTTATAYAEEKMEQLAKTNFTAVASGSDSVSGYTRSWSVVNNGAYKTITVSNSFTPIAGTARYVVIRDIITP